MTIKILMPALSPTMTEGNLARWLKNQGDTVRAGEPVCEIETDKATMEVEAVDEGVLVQILVPGGSKGVAVGTPIAVIQGENGAAGTSPALAPALAPVAPAPVSVSAAAPSAAPLASPPAARGVAMTPGGTPGGRLRASPLARRMAAQAGLDLGGVTGSGPGGRIVKTDIATALSRPRPAVAAVAPVAAAAVTAPAVVAAASAVAPAPVPAARPAGMDARDLADKLGQRYRAEANSTTRKTIARRLTESKQTIPHFYLTVDCAVDELLRVRADLNRAAAVKLSVNDFVVRAAALALRKIPAANSAWTDDAILLFDRADVAVAVAAPSGLITPVIREADGKGLATIATEMKDLAQRAREGRLRPEEYQGGSFTVSNLGMYGIRAFSAIINPPQACLLAVGAAESRPVVRDGALAVATLMTCTLSVDHRAVDGATGAQFLKAFQGLIENPLTMLL